MRVGMHGGHGMHGLRLSLARCSLNPIGIVADGRAITIRPDMVSQQPLESHLGVKLLKWDSSPMKCANFTSFYSSGFWKFRGRATVPPMSSSLQVFRMDWSI